MLALVIEVDYIEFHNRHFISFRLRGDTNINLFYLESIDLVVKHRVALVVVVKFCLNLHFRIKIKLPRWRPRHTPTRYFQYLHGKRQWSWLTFTAQSYDTKTNSPNILAKNFKKYYRALHILGLAPQKNTVTLGGGLH